MDYQKHYDRLIDRARNRILNDYKERHHIIPVCMEGTDDDYNLVDLTAEEHFVAHQLLVKIYPNNRKLISALSKMCCNSSKTRRTNRWYGWIRKLCSRNMSGENNPQAKLTSEQVIDIYYSEEPILDLAKKSNIGKGQITEIKRKVYYRNITKDIIDLPGYCKTGKKVRVFVPIDLVEKIFYDVGDYTYFKEKYGVTRGIVYNIKRKISYKKITSKLGIPGQVKRYNLSNDNISEIFLSKESLDVLSEKYGVHRETIRNIKKGITRYEMWEEF